jgi:hypothetical protein
MKWLNNLSTFFIVVFLGVIIYFSIVFRKPFSEVFNDIAVGLGALLAGLGGLKIFINWVEAKTRKDNFYRFKEIYSRDKFRSKDAKEGFRLLRNPASGKIYIYDLDTKKRHWIETMSTYYELGYIDNNQSKDWQNFSDISESEMNKYVKFEDGEGVNAQ